MVKCIMAGKILSLAGALICLSSFGLVLHEERALAEELRPARGSLTASTEDFRNHRGQGKRTGFRVGNQAAGVKTPTGGFSSNPFALEHRNSPAQSKGKVRISYGAGGERTEQPLALSDDGSLTVSTRKEQLSDDRLKPQRTPFSGGQHALPRMDEESSPEVSMQYKLGDTTSTRVTVNPQDSTSPLYRPAEREGLINAAGVYMDVNVDEDVQLQIGGEYADVENHSGSDGSSRGASVGLKWSF